jgi:uncharacterized membrane protein YedE/YeeE
MLLFLLNLLSYSQIYMFEALLNEPWPWYIGGPAIGIFVTLLLLIESKQLGISSSFPFVCSKISPIKFDYFNNQDKNAWQFWFTVGLVIAGYVIGISSTSYQIDISLDTIEKLSYIGIAPQEGFVPYELFQFNTKSMILLGIGGLCIGFGARYANGCTAGHAIMGFAQFAPASILATICFFIGGLLATYFILPYQF